MDNINFAKIYSVSKLKRFEECPKAFHFEYLDPIYSQMKTQLKRDPANIWPFQIIGRSVHDAITLFLHLPIDKQNLENLKEQLKLTWRSEVMANKLPPLGKWGGFKALEEERENYQSALQMLINFNKVFDKEIPINYLPTKDLKNSIEDYKKLVKPISNDYDVSGKFDLILDEDNSLTIVDFKTSKREDFDDFQLQFYKLLAELNFNLPVNKASFYFLVTGNIKEFDLAKKETDEIKTMILTKIAKIQKEKKWSPKPSKLCQYCLFRTFCPAKKEVAKFIQEPIKENLNEDLPF